MDTTISTLRSGVAWFKSKGWEPHAFQQKAWDAYLNGYSGIVNAPTGSGKTYSLLLPILMEYLNKPEAERKKGLQAIWITPIRALSKEIHQSALRAVEGLGLNWQVAMRTGDTSSNERSKQLKNPPELLITTPESMHLLLATKGYPKLFGSLEAVIVDEWHELIGSKRGVQMELAISRLRGLNPKLKTWGISATIGNLGEAMEVLMGPSTDSKTTIIRSNIEKRIKVESVIPREMDRFPRAGHLGIKLLPQILPIIEKSESTLIFTNTRAQCEIWYQQLLEIAPDLAGIIAMHHGSISREIRDWVEDSLHEGRLKAVVCTSSLDLGVDFRPVETIIQIGSPKGVGRFIQRAGRSGHQPGAISRIHFVPTHSLELIEATGLREAIKENKIEDRIPYIRSFDVLCQYLVTLSISEGFQPHKIFEEVKNTFSYQSINQEEWNWILSFITTGGSLHVYDDYKKVGVDDQGIYRILNKRMAQRHRLSMGTIVNDAPMQVKYVNGKNLGNIEEWFISQLKPGDVFWFAGRSLELVRMKEMVVQVKKSNAKTGKIPSYQGGRMPLSSRLSDMLRKQLEQLSKGNYHSKELKALKPVIELQQKRSHLPKEGELLIEYFTTREGHHLTCYPFEGRNVHEGMGALIAYRLSRICSISFTIAMNDYGFELLSDTPIPIDEALEKDLFSQRDLSMDIQQSLNEIEMAKRRFRDIASIAGLVFKGFPGQRKKERHLQSSSSLLFEVFNDYEPENLLFQQAFDEVRQFQLQEARLRESLKRINQQEIILKKLDKPTPFAFPIMVDRLRERISSEKLENRIKKMTLAYEE